MGSEERASRTSKLRERVLLLRERLAETRQKLKEARLSAKQAKRELLQMRKAHERALRELELLYELETSMGRAESLDELAKSAVELTGKACEAEAGALLYKPPRGPATQYLVLPAAGEVHAVVMQPGDGIAMGAMASGPA